MKELEIQLEEERSQRSQAVSAKKQLEAELQEAEAQAETGSRGKEEAVKQLRRLQVKPFLFPMHELRFSVLVDGIHAKEVYLLQGQMKEALRELEESRLARDEVISQSKDNEKKIQTLEAEVLHFTEVCLFNLNPTEILK